MEKILTRKWVIWFLIIMLVFEMFMIFQLSSTNKENLRKFQDYKTETESNLNSLNQKIKSIETDKARLSEKYDNLEKNYTGLQKNYAQLEKDFKFVKKEIDETTQQLNSYIEKVDSNMAWFRKNSNLNYTPEFMAGIESRANSEGYYIPQTLLSFVDYKSKCSIKSYGIYFSLFIWKFGYEDDAITTGKSDYLKNLSSFIKDRGGDCEDYSIFFKAAYNFLVDKCLEKGYDLNQIEIKSYVSGTGTIEIYPESEDSWELQRAEEVILKHMGNHMYVVCGTFYENEDIYLKESAGHCVVALSPQQINDSKDVYNVLKNAELIEPQSGQYIGDMNSIKTSSIFNDGQMPSEPYIWIVITDDDLYQFDEDEHQWTSYGYFGGELSKQVERLKSLLQKN